MSKAHRSNRPVPELLREASGFFRSLSPHCLASVCEVVEEASVGPGEAIWESGGSEDGRLCVLASGTAEFRTAESRRSVQVGEAAGEAGLLGFADLPGDRGVLRATSCCTAQVLTHDALRVALAGHEAARRSVAGLLSESDGTREPRQLQELLRRSAVFDRSKAAFTDLLCEHLETLVMAPGEILFRPGDPCLPEESPCFLVLTGQILVEGEGGALVWTASQGEVLGAGGPIGPAETRTMTARAWSKGLVSLAKLPGAAFELAFRDFPEELGPLEETVGKLDAMEEEATRNRLEWLHDVAVPTLARTPLLAGCPEPFLRALSCTLAEATHDRGEELAAAGGPAESMLVVLEGSVDLLSKHGAKIGALRKDGIYGEAELLGLASVRLVTIRAASPCRVLWVTSEALQAALAGPEAGPMGAALEALVKVRREQAERALPLSGLELGCKPEDLGMQTAGLLAERLNFQPGQFWEPVPDLDPCGPHVSVFLRGRAVVTMAPDDKEVLPLTPGSLVPEGALAEFDARVRVLSGDCEVYRFRRSELEAAARVANPRKPARSAAQEAADWFYRYRLTEKEARSRLQEKLSSAKGLMATKEAHPCDSGIKDWSKRRQKSVKRAEQMRQERAETIGEGRLQLPLLPAHGSTLGFAEGSRSSWSTREERKRPLAPKKGTSSYKALPCLPPSLSAYPVMQLPRVHSDSQLRRLRSLSRERAPSRERPTRDQPL